MNVQELDAETATLTTRLAELRRQRGAAVLSGKTFDDRELDRLQKRLDGLNDAKIDAEEVATAEARDQHRRAVDDHRRELRSRVHGAETKRLGAIAKAEAAATELGVALAEAFSVGDEISQALAELHAVDGRAGVFETPRPINGPNRQATAGMRVAMALNAATGLRHLGGLNLGQPLPASRDTPTTSWREDEEAAMRAELNVRGVR